MQAVSNDGAEVDSGWHLYDELTELTRMGVSSDPEVEGLKGFWRISHINSAFKVRSVSRRL